MTINTTSTIKTASYSRVSTLHLGQSIENQITPIQEFCKARDFNLVAQYSDEGISGRRDKRPGLDQMLRDARLGKFKIIVVVEISRLARDVRHLLNLLHELSEIGVSVVSLREGIDMSSALGRAMVTLLGVFAQVESDLLRERVRAALYTKKLAAEIAGKKFNIGRPSVTTPEIEKRIHELRAEGHSIRKIHQLLDKKVGTTTIQTILKKGAK